MRVGYHLSTFARGQLEVKYRWSGVVCALSQSENIIVYPLQFYYPRIRVRVTAIIITGWLRMQIEISCK